MGLPQNGWCIMKNPTWMWVRGTPILGNLQWDKPPISTLINWFWEKNPIKMDDLGFTIGKRSSSPRRPRWCRLRSEATFTASISKPQVGVAGGLSDIQWWIIEWCLWSRHWIRGDVAKTQKKKHHPSVDGLYHLLLVILGVHQIFRLKLIFF